MDSFTKLNCKQINNDIENALKFVEDKWGVTVTVCGGRLTSDTFTPKVVVNLGTGVDAGKKDWVNHCFKFCLRPEQFGTRFMSNGTEYTVCGLKPRSTRYPVLAKNDRGTTYKFPAAIVPDA